MHLVFQSMHSVVELPNEIRSALTGSTMPKGERWVSTLVALALASAILLAACSAEPRSSSTSLPSDTLLPVNGTRLWVHREGHGPPAIVVHGGPVLDQTYLRENLKPLTHDLELIYYDQRLSGRSEGVVDSASVRLDTFVEDIEGLRSALGLDTFHLIGHSWGGLLALKYAVAHPRRLRSLILLSPMPPSASLWREEQGALATSLAPEDTTGMGALRQSTGFRAQQPEAIQAALRISFRSQFHDPTLADSLDFHIEPDYGERSRQFGYMLPDLVAYDVIHDLGRVTAPALVLYGAEEPGARIGGEALSQGLPRDTLVTIPDAGHFPFVERKEAFFEAVRRFLAR